MPPKRTRPTADAEQSIAASIVDRPERGVSHDGAAAAERTSNGVRRDGGAAAASRSDRSRPPRRNPEDATSQGATTEGDTTKRATHKRAASSGTTSQKGRATTPRARGDNGVRPARDTERALIETATALFAEKGYKGTSLADLAEPLGVTPASLYYYVASKQELLLRVLTTAFSGVLQGLEAITESEVDSRRKLELAVRNHFEFVLGNPRAVAVFLRERRFLESPYREQYQERIVGYDALFTALLREGIDNGAFPAVDPSLSRLAILGVINWAVEWYEPGGRLTPEQVTDQMLEFILHGVLGATDA